MDRDITSESDCQACRLDACRHMACRFLVIAMMLGHCLGVGCTRQISAHTSDADVVRFPNANGVDKLDFILNVRKPSVVYVSAPSAILIEEMVTDAGTVIRPRESASMVYDLDQLTHELPSSTVLYQLRGSFEHDPMEVRFLSRSSDDQSKWCEFRIPIAERVATVLYRVRLPSGQTTPHRRLVYVYPIHSSGFGY